MSDNPRAKPPLRAYFALMVGVLSVSSGAILVRYAQQEAASLPIAAYRMGIAFLVVLVPTCVKQGGELGSLTYRDVGLGLTSGLFLAIHFATWIYSLEMTSVAISVVMVNTAPLWVGLLTPVVTRDRLARSTMFGIALSVMGAAAIGWGLERSGTSSNDLLGGILATVGAVGLAVYLLIGRNLRRRHSLGVYVTVCYGAAAGYLCLAAIATNQRMIGFSVPTWLYLLGLALVSQILGHTTNNWALRFFSASMIAVALLGEPILSTLLAFFLFNESLTAIQLTGAALILLGIHYAARAEQRGRTSPGDYRRQSK
ncbi:MAG: DMT family transporter [Planctomycetota bacterium]